MNVALNQDRDNTATLRHGEFDRGRISLASGRESDIRLGTVLAEDTENTFVFTVPARDVSDPQRSDDAPESPVADDNENNDWEAADLNDAEDSQTSDDPKDMEADVSMLENTLQNIDTSATAIPRFTKKKMVKISKYGIQYPSLPAGVVKKLATKYARTAGSSKTKISKDTLDAIIQASDWFFEQVSDDLGAYSKHARRKTIDESDIITLMKRYA
jgi:histone H3/H4